MKNKLANVSIPIVFPVNKNRSSELIIEDKTDALIECHPHDIPTILHGALCRDQDRYFIDLRDKALSFRYQYWGREYQFDVSFLDIDKDGRCFAPFVVVIYEKLHGQWMRVYCDARADEALSLWNRENWERVFKEQVGSLASFCSKHSPRYGSYEKILRYFRHSAQAGAPLKLHPSGKADHMLYIHPGAAGELAAKADESRVSAINAHLGFAVEHHVRDFALYDEFFKRFAGDCQLAHAFKNEYGEVEMAMFDLWDFRRRDPRQQYPVVPWRMNGVHTDYITYAPGDTPMPLWGKERLAGPEVRNALVTDSVAFADLNAEAFQDDTALVAFWDFDSLDNVAWSPLKRDDLNTRILISNLNGETLAESYERADQLKAHLESLGINVAGFIQLPIKHTPVMRRIASLDDVIAAHLENPPVVEKEHIKELSPCEYVVELAKAREAVSRGDCSWWSVRTPAPVNNSAIRPGEDTLQKYSVYPILPRGKNVMMYGPKTSGKSFITQIICGCLTKISSKPVTFLPPLLFTVGKHPDGYPTYKICCMDFENGSDIEDRLAFLEKQIWAGGNADRGNLFIKNLKTTAPCDYTQPNERHRVLQILKECEAAGTPGQKPDFLVIDTYTRFIGGRESTTTTNALTETLKEIRRVYPDLTVVILTHTAEDGSVKGFKEKQEDMNVIISLSRPNGRTGSLTCAPVDFEIKHMRGVFPGFYFRKYSIGQDVKTKMLKIDDPASEMMHRNIIEFDEFFGNDPVRMEYLNRQKSSYYELLKKAQNAISNKK